MVDVDFMSTFIVALLEASKAKHQAMVAQAHATAKKIQTQLGNEGGLRVPHPPEGPPSKAYTAHPHRAYARYPSYECIARVLLVSDICAI